MALPIGAIAPDFEAETTEGKIKFHDWIGNSWALLFSHPKDFTPVCTTELGALAKLKPEFDKRGVKLMGLSVDPVDRHSKWSEDIKETQGAAPNYPMIGDTDYNVSKLYDMLPAVDLRRSLDAHGRRQPDRPQRLRHRSRQEDQAGAGLSDDDRPQFPGNPARDRLAAADRQAQRRDAGRLEAGRGRDHRRLGQRRARPRRSIPQGWKSPKPYIRIVPQPK